MEEELRYQHRDCRGCLLRTTRILSSIYSTTSLNAMCLFFKATRILSFCIPVTNTHFGTKLTRCFPGPAMQPHRFVCSQGAGGGPSCTRRLRELNTQRLSWVRALVPGRSQNLHSHSWTAAPVFLFFSSKVWGQEEEGGRMTVHFSW